MTGKLSHHPTFPWGPCCSSVTLSFTQGSQHNLGLAKPPNQGWPSEDPTLSEEQWEVYYGNLSFHGRKPQESEDPEATSNEYSEI